MSEIFDRMGRVIRPDQVVVYPVRRRSRMWLERARVLEIHSQLQRVVCLKDSGRRVTLTIPNNIAIVEQDHYAAV